MRKATMKMEDAETTEATEAAAPAKEEAPIGGALGVILPPEAKAAAKAPEVEGPKVSKYKVANHNGISVLLGGGKTQLAYGKIVDDVNYDIDLLKRSGVQLEAV